MNISVNLEDRGDGKWRASVEVDGVVSYSVTALSKIGALASLSALTEADLDEQIAVHTAVRASLQDVGREDQQRDLQAQVRELFNAPPLDDDEKKDN